MTETSPPMMVIPAGTGTMQIPVDMPFAPNSGQTCSAFFQITPQNAATVAIDAATTLSETEDALDNLRNGLSLAETTKAQVRNDLLARRDLADDTGYCAVQLADMWENRQSQAPETAP